MITEKNYGKKHYNYTDIEQQTWNKLFDRQVAAVERFAYEGFLPGILQLAFTNEAIPHFDAINQRLSNLNGWSIYAVPGLVDNDYFFEQMATKQFGATAWMRTPEQLDYLEEPDMFHDVFGHVPLLTDRCICAFLEGLAHIAGRHHGNAVVIEAIARIYWYTVEFGLVRENEQLKIYGAGILSSIGETSYALSGVARLEPFDIATIIATPYIKDKYQEQYFVLESVNDLTSALPLIERYLHKNH